MRLHGTGRRTGARRLQSSLSEFESRLFPLFLWSAPFILLTQWSGTARGLCEANAKIVHQLGTLLIIALCCSLPFGNSRSRRPRFITSMWRACERLPLHILLFAAAWLACVAWSSFSSTTQRLSLDFLGYDAWLLFLATLTYGLAASRRDFITNILSGAIVALDFLLLREAARFTLSFFTDNNSPVLQWLSEDSLSTENMALYGSLLLPVTIVRAAVEPQSRNSELQSGHQIQIVWRVVRPLGVAILCIAPASAFIGLAVALAMVVVTLLLTINSRLSNDTANASSRVLKVPHLAAVLTATMFITIGAKTLAGTMHWDTETHRVLWNNATAIVMARPLTGSGPGAFTFSQLPLVPSGAPRVLSSDAANLPLQRMAEEGVPALLCWLILVVSIIGSAALRTTTALRNRTKVPPAQMALLCGLLLYAIASCFAAGEATPVIGVHFFVFLALLGATLWPQQSAEDPTSTQASQSGSISIATSRWAARLILVAGLVGVACATPWLVRTGRAHVIYDRALAADSLPRRVALLRQARDLDLEQPIYWAQLAQAQHTMHGTPVARAATNVYRAAALRSPNDALFWHNIATLFWTAGDATNVIRNETRAMQADPSFAPYQEVLSQAYAQLGNTKKAEAHTRLGEQFRTRGHQTPDTAQTPTRYRRLVVQPEFVPLQGSRR
jgi:hypothetical protein